MKKLLTLGLLVFAGCLFAQKRVAKQVQELLSKKEIFYSYSVLSHSNIPLSAEVKKTVDKAGSAELQLDVLHQLMTDRKNTIEITIPYQRNNITVQMYRADVLAEGFHVDSPAQRNVGYNPGLYYRGIIKGDENSLVAFSFFNGELYGVISAEGIGNVVVAKVRKKNNVSDYVVYSDAALKIKHDFTCHTRDEAQEQNPNNRSNDVLSAKCVTIYFEVDNDLYQDNGSSTTATTNWMTAVFNNVQTIYNNDGITTAIKSIYIWTTPDPYDGIGSSSSDYLFKFNEIRPVFDGDLGQLVGRDDGGLGGVAVGINGICTQDNFSYSDLSIDYETVPTFSWTIEVITHELGHLMGSPHTHACVWNGNNTAIDGCGPTANSNYTEGSCDTGPLPSNSVKGTIMSYCHLLGNIGISFSNGFGPQPAARILGKVNAGTCLSTDCINTCINTVSSISTTNVTGGAAQISWVDTSGASNWQVAVTPFDSTNIVWNNVNTPSYNATGLSANEYYKVRVRPLCGGGLQAPDEKAIVLTSASYCSGITLTDTGGSNDNYEDSETYIRTIIPNLPNKKIRLTFTEFDLEQDYDYLYVYDGNSTSAPDLSGGGFTGNGIPGPFVSTSADGSLTLKFYSDGGVTAPGYVASVACENALANNSFDSDIDFTYWPNPVKGLLNISAQLNLNDILVYNPEGRLLYQKQLNQPTAQVDLSSFARGTYFFTLKFGDREAHFKIVKTN